jgi:hypothetical protein
MRQRKLAAQLGSISHMTVTHIWAKHAFQAFDRKDHKLHKCRYTNKP